MSLVSVIIPYFRKKHYISQSLNSVLKQTYRKLEIIIVYDDTDKNDLDYIKKLASKDRRIKLKINKKNLGAGISRNIGIKFSKGEFISFIDADDIWSKNKIKKQLNFMKKNKFNFTHTSYSIVDRNKKILSYRHARNFFTLDDLIKSCDIGLSTVMIKRDVLKGLKFPKLKTKEDFVLWLELLKRNIKIYSIKSNLVSWKKLSHSLSSSIFQKFFDAFKVYRVYMKFNFFKSFYYVVCLSFNFLKK